MPSLPDYAIPLFQGLRRSFDPSVERTDMERGVPKQRVINSGVMMRQAMTLYFESIQTAEAFETWYFEELERIGWFTMRHPYTGAEITARFPGGDIGELVPDEKEPGDYRRDLVIEYLR
ncbi:hypothetical protein GCM10009090_16640 [[Pseudomonas] boreopolis]|uniref:Uncharacterized protein n=2 Tax=Xanthomonas boreopolis TaxID=86183 RepID=A0A919F7Y5_9XANT|nr:hypothetical protein GCM10009090_16640 [[Pseudomonas] boreopolis]